MFAEKFSVRLDCFFPKKIAKALIGGNWKCNGTMSSIKSMADVLMKGGAVSPNSEGKNERRYFILVRIDRKYYIRHYAFFFGGYNWVGTLTKSIN